MMVVILALDHCCSIINYLVRSLLGGFLTGFTDKNLIDHENF